MFKNNEKARKPWPKDCKWPKPIYDGEGSPWTADDVDPWSAGEYGQYLMKVKDYYDSLVDDHILNEDYSLNVEQVEAVCDNSEEGFVPEMGDEFWDDGFDISGWEEELTEHMNRVKLEICGNDADRTAYYIMQKIGYQFNNENLLRQAFTRRAFAIEYGLRGCNEEMEFLGDSVLNSVVTREIIRQLTRIEDFYTEAPFASPYNEGDLTKLRSRFVSKEYLAERAVHCGLDQYILYGSGEQPTESSREDMMEALIGAVTLDSGWDYKAIDEVIDRLLQVQLGNPDAFLKETYYDLFNAWHQKHFGVMPQYEVHPALEGRFDCTIRFFVPENDKGIREDQRIDVREDARSTAREQAARDAYRFVNEKGLWMNLKDAGIEPDVENSINQLQELYQKKYLDTMPKYEFEELPDDRWECSCFCGGLFGWGRGTSKTEAKKRAAYMALIHLLDSAGICKRDWIAGMYEGVV